MPAVVLEARSIIKAFGRNRVLRGVSLSVSAGDTYVLFGPNGAGKTTLVKVLSGLMKADSGEVLVFGEGYDEDPRGIKARIGVLSHEPYLYDELSARENLDFFGRLYDVPHRGERVRSMLKEVGLYTRSHDRVGTFSRGMRQRLGLARALLHDPDLVLLDEPYTGLDVGATETLDGIIRDKAKEGKAFFAITHDLDHGLEMANRAGIIDGGKLVHEAERSGWDELRSRYRETMGGDR
jgi:heme ABC exporter ATP-binding subunit CcmA